MVDELGRGSVMRSGVEWGSVKDLWRERRLDGKLERVLVAMLVMKKGCMRAWRWEKRTVWLLERKMEEKKAWKWEPRMVEHLVARREHKWGGKRE
jgi:hypothetical protein